jgi:hypothetical protein
MAEVAVTAGARTASTVRLDSLSNISSSVIATGDSAAVVTSAESTTEAVVKAESAGVELSCLFNALFIGFISTGPSAVRKRRKENAGLHPQGGTTLQIKTQSKPLKARPASQRFLQLSCSAKPFALGMKAARDKQGFVNYV